MRHFKLLPLGARSLRDAYRALTGGRDWRHILHNVDVMSRRTSAHSSWREPARRATRGLIDSEQEAVESYPAPSLP